MKKLILSFLKNTLTNELRGMFTRNITNDERDQIHAILVRLRDKLKDGVTKDVITIFINALN